MANSVDPDQTAPIGAVCSGSTLFVPILIASEMLGNYLQHTTLADNIFRCFFFLGANVLGSSIYVWLTIPVSSNFSGKHQDHNRMFLRNIS